MLFVVWAVGILGGIFFLIGAIFENPRYPYGNEPARNLQILGILMVLFALCAGV